MVLHILIQVNVVHQWSVPHFFMKKSNFYIRKLYCQIWISGTNKRMSMNWKTTSYWIKKEVYEVSCGKTPRAKLSCSYYFNIYLGWITWLNQLVISPCQNGYWHSVIYINTSNVPKYLVTELCPFTLMVGWD